MDLDGCIIHQVSIMSDEFDFMYTFLFVDMQRSRML